MAKSIINLNDPLELVTQFFDLAEQAQSQKFDEYIRLYQDYKGYQDLKDKDPYMAYPTSPLPFAIIESMTARDIATIFGVTPIVPVRSMDPAFSDDARAHQDALQCLFDFGDFRNQLGFSIKQKRLFGLSFIEPHPFYDEIRVDEQRLKTFNGFPVGVETVEEVVKRFRFRFTPYSPWEIYRDPSADTLSNARGVVKVSLVSVSQLIKRAKRGDFGNNYNIQGITDEPPSRALSQDHGKTLKAAVGRTIEEQDPDIKFLLRYEEDDRYIDILDFKHVLRDRKNPNAHGKINLVALVNNDDPNPAMRFDGISEIKPIESTVAMYNMAMAQLINNHSMQNHGVFLYQRGKVTPDQMIMRPGARWEVTGLLGNQTPLSVVQQIPVNPLPPDAYKIPIFLESTMRLAVNFNEQDEGSARTAGTTATGDAIRRQQSDNRKSMTIAKLESQLGEIADLCFSHMDQRMLPEDWASLIGLERAQAMQSTNPNKIPGGCRFHFTGKDRAQEQLVKRREMIDLISVVGVQPILLKKLFDSYGWTESEFEELMQGIQQQQQQAAQAEAQGEQGELEALFKKKRVSGAAQIENKIDEVVVGLKALPGQTGQSKTNRSN